MAVVQSCRVACTAPGPLLESSPAQLTQSQQAGNEPIANRVIVPPESGNPSGLPGIRRFDSCRACRGEMQEMAGEGHRMS